MFTSAIMAAILAGVAVAKAIGKGVQAKRQRESREKGQAKHLSAMEQAGEQLVAYRQQYKQEGTEGLRHQQEQLQPLQDAMTRAYGGIAGYQAPDMSWLMNPPEARANVGPEVRKVKAKKGKPATRTETSGPQGGSWRTDPTGGGSQGPTNFRTETGGTGAPSTTGGPR